MATLPIPGGDNSSWFERSLASILRSLRGYRRFFFSRAQALNEMWWGLTP
jgi:hypothetical protein